MTVYSLFPSEDEISEFQSSNRSETLGTPLRKELHRLIMSSAQPSLVKRVKKINSSTIDALTEAWKSALSSTTAKVI